MFTNDSNYLTSVPAQTFASLTDTPANFTGHGGKFVKVNVGENALEFVTSGSSQNAFSTIAVAGQSNVEADSVGDTLNLVAGTNVTITTVAGTDSVTINSTASGLTNLVDDTTPELGGNLSLNSKDVTGTGNINITGSLTSTGSLGHGIGFATGMAFFSKFVNKSKKESYVIISEGELYVGSTWEALLLLSHLKIENV